jgi:hypothetical protein
MVFFVILNELLGEEESLRRKPRVIVVRPGKVAFIMIRPMKPRDTSLSFRMTIQGVKMKEKSWKTEWEK